MVRYPLTPGAGARSPDPESEPPDAVTLLLQARDGEIQEIGAIVTASVPDGLCPPRSLLALGLSRLFRPGGHSAREFITDWNAG
jgi:hypothetical protein